MAFGCVPVGDTVHFDVVTNDGTGEAVDADEAPTFSVFEQNTDAPVLGPLAMTKRTDLVGDYRGSFAATAANGFEADKFYSVIVSATVGGKFGKDVPMVFRATDYADVAAALRDLVVLTVASPSARLVDAGGGQLTAVTLGQVLAAVMVALVGDRAGVGTATVTASLPGVPDGAVEAERVSASAIRTTVTVPAAG